MTISPTELANYQTLVGKAPAAIANNQTFLALTAPTNAQTLAQVEALTRQVNAIIRLLVGQLEAVDDT